MIKSTRPMYARKSRCMIRMQLAVVSYQTTDKEEICHSPQIHSPRAVSRVHHFANDERTPYRRRYFVVRIPSYSDICSVAAIEAL